MVEWGLLRARRIEARQDSALDRREQELILD